MIAPARRAAIDALTLNDADHLDLGAAIARVRVTLDDERDGALLLELVAGTLRMRAAIDYQLASRVKRPLARLDAAVLNILRLSAFQLIYMSRLPASAVINDAVELTRRAGKSSAAGLTNAVLRALSRDRERLSWPSRDDLAGHLSVVYSHPRWLVERWIDRYGVADTEAWLSFNNQPAPLCLAVNRRFLTREALAEELAADGVSTQPTARAAYGLQVLDGRALGTRAFREGRFVVQDEASQLIGELASPPGGATVLDLCASPGGKTLALSASVGPAGLVIASDVRQHRVRLLARTLGRCRVENARVVQVSADGALPFTSGQFDQVLIDAPCSGLGTVRRDPDIRWRRSASDLPGFAAAQRALLDRAADLVRAGGSLVYSTCSSEPEENEAVVDAFLAAHPDFTRQSVHQTLPFRDQLEAFFGAVLRRSTIG
ncbi:MAG TPA: 16S rRNA (cytosine(967)-C(5))-methyltransferase RsmB [Vicinamibacterales bacterium]|nr:16S rRNA (cytosine(967)-C(5))-methyltransferase RsmB [Vicinamibacterales bacterium]